MSRWPAVALALLPPVALSAELPPPSSVLVEPGDLSDAALSAEPDRATASVPEGQRVRQVTVKQGRGNFWDAQILIPTRESVAKGDVLYVTFRMRTERVRDESGEGSAVVYFQRRVSPWEKSVTKRAEAGPEWMEFAFAFASEHDFAAGEAVLGFGFGEREEIVDVADVRLVNYGRTLAPETLPQTRTTYAGREPDAAWRKAAAERIERNRKADATVLVKDAEGKPVAGAKVRLRMTRHAFWFGSAVSIRWVNDSSPDGKRYRKEVASLFNHIVVENALKWPAWAGEWNLTGAGTLEEALGWLKGEGLHTKGHVLVWPSFRNMPKAVAPLRDDPEALRAAIADRVTRTATEFRDTLDEWDVVNEPFDNHDAMDLLGRGAMVDWFRLAKEAAPDARLYINDYAILAAGGRTDTEHQAHYEDTVRFLLENGAPLGGIGLQGHFGENVTPPDTLMKILDRFAAFGVPLQITEFDVDTTDETLLADYTRDFMTTVFSDPAVSGFVMWGFWEGAHWKPKSAMFRRDWSERPNAAAYRDLVFRDWWTDVEGVTDADGKFEARGFLGDYTVRVGDVERGFRLPKEGATVEVNPD